MAIPTGKAKGRERGSTEKKREDEGGDVQREQERRLGKSSASAAVHTSSIQRAIGKTQSTSPLLLLHPHPFLSQLAHLAQYACPPVAHSVTHTHTHTHIPKGERMRTSMSTGCAQCLPSEIATATTACCLYGAAVHTYEVTEL